MIGVIGLSYVGLPLVREFIHNNFQVIGFDVYTKKVAALDIGHSYIRHIPSELIDQFVRSGTVELTGDFFSLREADVVPIYVSVPLEKHYEPDLSYILSTTEAIASTLHTGQLIVLESTTYPGTTEEEVLPIFA